MKMVLTKREREVAELLAWGASKSEVADQCFISERTVENHTRNIYEKTGCGKVNELSAWWFCTRFNISFELSPLKRTLMSFAFLMLLTPQIFNTNSEIVRRFRTRTSKTETCTARRKSESDVY